MARGTSTAGAQTVEVDGRRLRVSNLDKVLYPETGTTKADVIAYYVAIAPALIPYSANRAVTRKRWPNGVGTDAHPLDAFFEKDLGNGVPDWVQRRAIEHSSGPKQYPLVEDRATLAWLAQAAALELHVPQWQFARTGGARNPDRMVLDFDPGPGVDLATTAQIALLAKDILEGMGLDPHPLTSGSKGIHVYTALDGSLSSDQVSAVAHELAKAMEADHPDDIVSDMKKALRGGKVLIDWSQNNGKKTTIAPYSLRGRPHPTVAAPRTWDELRDPGLRHLDYREVLERFEADGDLLRPLLRSRDAGLEPTPEHLATFTATPDSQGKLDKYRSMRDANKTPEPVPEDLGMPGSGRSFVIQEHHARRLHYDFRLEHDGVLVSWAIPKGPPTDPKKNHLAVQTEDHPLEYGTFEGEIPAGEYGGGQVSIWDAGEFDLEKWRDGAEVIATLQGRPDGGLGGEPRRFALIHTGQGGDEKNWMIHLMAPKGGGGAGGPDGAADERDPDRVPSAFRSGFAPAPLTAAQRLPSASTLPGGTRYVRTPAGDRLVVAVDGDDVLMWDEKGRAAGKRLAHVVSAASALPTGCALEGVAADDAFVATDLLAVAGRDIRDQPFRVRRQLLERLAGDGEAPLALADSTDDTKRAGRWRAEGVVATGADEPYPGERVLVRA
jgi:bifunctional non-homologous end joining protein LigD